jgi:hypothetical protein
MNGKAKCVPAVGGSKASVYGGQTFNKSIFPPTKYIQGLLHAYCPDTNFDAVSRCIRCTVTHKRHWLAWFVALGCIASLLCAFDPWYQHSYTCA